MNGLKKTCGKHGNRICRENCKKCFSASFASHFRAKNWSSKNKKQPYEFSRGASDKAIFDCDVCPHDFEKSINKVSGSNEWCVYCAKTHGKLCNEISCEHCKKRSVAGQSFGEKWSSKNDVEAHTIFANSIDIFIFDCECGHDYPMKPNEMVRGKRCIYCSKKPKLCKDDNCEICYKKSFASHEMAKDWSNENDETAREVTLTSAHSYKFKCKECKHKFELQPSNATKCQYCHSFKICDDDNCKFCLKKSFASHKYAKYWHKSNKLSPRQIPQTCNKSFKFNCPDCPHVFSQLICYITQRNILCQYCAPMNGKLCGKKSCKYCWDRSLAARTDILALLHSSNKIKQPWKLFPNMKTRYEFNCDKCPEPYEAAISNIVSGTRCPHCKNKTEKKLFNWLQLIYEYIIGRQARYEWCRKVSNNYHLPFDFDIEELKLFIELDGPQHYQYIIKGRQTPSEIQTHDLYKMKQALANGYTVIRVLQEDVFYDQNDWEAKLLKHVHKYNKPQIILLDDDGEYDVLRRGISNKFTLTKKDLDNKVERSWKRVRTSKRVLSKEDIVPKKKKNIVRSKRVNKKKLAKEEEKDIALKKKKKNNVRSKRYKKLLSVSSTEDDVVVVKKKPTRATKPKKSPVVARSKKQ